MSLQPKLKHTPIIKQTVNPNVETENKAEEQVYKALNEIKQTLERVLKTFEDVKWLDGENKERTWDKYRLESLRHLALTETEEKQFKKIQKCILEAHSFIGWSLRENGWNSQKVSASEKPGLRLKILKVALSCILGIIINTLPINSKLYPSGEVTEEDTQQSFDLVIWEMVQKVVTSLRSVENWSDDPDLESILNLNPNLETVLEVKSQSRIAETGNGFRLVVLETNLLYEKEFGEQIRLIAPTVTTITMESMKECCIFIKNSNIKSLIIQSAYVMTADGLKKEFLIFVDGKFYDKDLESSSETPFVFIDGKQASLDQESTQDYFAERSDIFYNALDKPSDIFHLKVSKQGEVEVLGLKFEDGEITAIENYMENQIQNKNDLEGLRQKSLDRRLQNNQKYRQKK
jgi:hypothetical protein